MLPPEGMVNEMGYYYMQQGMKDKALSMFSLNIHNYPESANAYDSMGDYYSAQKDKDKAIASYKRSLELKDNADTKKKLEKLQADK